LRFTHHDEIPAGHAGRRADTVFAEEFAVHRRYSPVPAGVEDLADLPSVAEVAEVATEFDRLFREFELAENSRGRTGQHALADAVDDGLFQRSPIECEEKQPDARPAVGSLFRCQFGVNPRFAVAADDACAVPGGLLPGDP